jgi:hypothetical protein
MGYLIKPELLTKTVIIGEGDFISCGTNPVLLILGKPGIVFQLISIMAQTDGNYTLGTTYTIISDITSGILAETSSLGFFSSKQPCIYVIGSSPTSLNTQFNGNNLQISTKNGDDPTGTGDVTFKIVYRELSF